MATLKRVFRDAKKREQSQITKDPQQRAQSQIAATETWCVVYDGYVDNKLDVLVASGLPRVGLAYGGLFCSRVNPVRSSESPFVWDVTVDYVSLQLQTTPSGNWNIYLTRGSVSREEAIVKDRLGLLLVNTVGDLLPKQPKVTLYDEQLTISWSTSNVPSWSDSTFEGKTNSDAVSFTICGISRSFTQGQMKCTGMPLKCTRTVVGQDGSGNPINQLTYDCEMSFQIRKPRWIWYAPNEGIRGYNDSDVLVQFADDMGQTLSAPTFLTLDGHAVAVGDVPLRLPDDAYGHLIPQGNRTYDDPGAFEIEEQVAFSGLFTGLNDSDQIP